MARYKIYKYSYSFEKPLLLNETQFNEMRSRIPIYPEPDNINEIILKKYWGYVFCLFPPFFVFFVLIPLMTGSFEPAEYIKSLKQKNNFYKNYYDSIYYSKSYNDYLIKNKGLKSNF